MTEQLPPELMARMTANAAAIAQPCPRCGVGAGRQCLGDLHPRCDASDADECAMIRERSVAGTDRPIPECATHAPWSDEDDAELERAMADARHAVGAMWPSALRGGATLRGIALDPRTGFETYTALRMHAGRSGLVPLVDDPTGPRRVHELVSVWSAFLDWSHHIGQDHHAMIASHDDFEERTAIRSRAAAGWAIVRAAFGGVEPTPAGLDRAYPGSVPTVPSA